MSVRDPKRFVSTNPAALIDANLSKPLQKVDAPFQRLGPGRNTLRSQLREAWAADKLPPVPEEEIADMARGQGHAKNYFTVLLRLGHRAPELVAAVVEGRQPQWLTRQQLARIPVALEWNEQRRALRSD